MCSKEISLRKNSCFANSKLNLYEYLQLLVYFLEDKSMAEIIRTWLFTKQCISKYFGLFRQVCIDFCDENFAKLGNNSIVEIDETVISRRKFNRGRIIKQQWLFGCIERGTNNFLLKRINGRSKKVLEEVINDCILEDSTVMSDCWSSYLSIFGDRADIEHYTVNHSKNFVDPTTGAHTQSIESLWSRLKKSLRSKSLNHSEHLNEYLGEFAFRIKTKITPKEKMLEYFIKKLEEKNRKNKLL